MNKKERISAFLQEKPNVRFGYLFGSRVKGYETATSDWDLAVYLDRSDESDSWPVFQLEAELSREIGENVQITDLNRALTPLLGFEIVRDGEEIADKDDDMRIEVSARLLRQYFDWRYFEDRHKKVAKRREKRMDGGASGPISADSL
jgi:predicted nucleotidyltransferase